MTELKKLKMYKKNPRRNDHVVAQAKRAIENFGFRVPVLAKKDGEIIDGHLRLKAAKALGHKEIPVIFVDDMSEDQIRAFRLSINKISELADWDLDLLKGEFDALREADFDFSTTSFEAYEISELFQPEEEVKPVGTEEQFQLDEQKKKRRTTCPACGYRF